jgi:predicted P-loop ATPase
MTNTMAPPSILKKKETPKASGPSEQQGDDSMNNDSLKKLERENSLSSVDRRSAFANMKSVSQNTEQEGSLKDLMQVLDIKKQTSMKGSIQFADDVEVNEISRLRNSSIDFCFYSEESLSNFRYEAFMEDAGLDPADYA